MYMKKVSLILILTLLTLSGFAQSWRGVSGPPQKNLSTGAFRWNFGRTDGIFDPSALYGTLTQQNTNTTAIAANTAAIAAETSRATAAEATKANASSLGSYLLLSAYIARNAANFGQTGPNADIGHAVDPGLADGTYRVGGWVKVLSVSGGYAIKLQVTFTDESGSVQTLTFYPQGATSPNQGAVGFSSYPTIDMRILSGTTVTVSTVTAVGTGSILYDAGTTIQKLQ
jgi:hypothetical protein